MESNRKGVLGAGGMFLAAGVFAVSASLSAAPYGAFEEAPVAAIRPTGHLKEFLRRQADGMTGHPEKLGYPFNTKMWAGPLSRVFFTEGVYNGDDEPKDCEGEEFWKSGLWWPYEQTAYQLDGMARVAQFIDAPVLDATVKQNLDWVYSHANPTNGDIFAALSASPSQWPNVVFFRAALAYAEKHDDWDRLVKVFAANYEGKKGERAKWTDRNALNLEGMLKVMEFTKDPSLLADARAMYAKCWESKAFGRKKHIIQHGVSFSEMLKIPCILYLYTGEKAYLDQAKAAVENVYEMDEQADGLFSANEYTSGRDPRQGHETCVTADMMWSLGYFIQADGDVKMADRMERIAYNALPGSCTKDFKRHQYLSSVNQAVCGPFAQSAHFNYGESTWRQYRRAHFPQCCTGNINRSMPSFVRRMWLKSKKDGAPVAMLYGPSEYAGEQDGVRYTIVEETAYPFEDEVRFTLKSEKPLKVALRCRIPGWCVSPDAGTLVTRTLETGKTLALALPVKLTLESDRNWHWIRRGALTFTFVPPATVTEDEPGDPFTALRIMPKPGEWNYAFDLAEIKVAVANAKVEFRKADYPFETPAMSVKLPVRRIREWQVLDEGRFMPDPPLCSTPTGERAEIEFVPYATTLQRITCLPDTEPRERLATVAAYGNGELFPYKDGVPLAEQVFDPEKWSDKDFRKLYRVPPRQADVYFDLGAMFAGQSIAGKMTYLMFRVWSDRDEAKATWCLSAGYEVQAFIDGKEVYRTDGMTEGVRMAPVWIDHPVKKGYNYMLVKLARPGYVTKQYPQFWGAKLDVFLSAREGTLCSFADPFVGTEGAGHTHPGAAAPFGFVQAGPDTGSGTWAYCSGYRFTDKATRGFSQTHLSGTGCPDLGDILLLPFVGELKGEKPAVAYVPGSQKATPGFYACELEGGVKVSVTATERVAYYRFVFPAGVPAKVLVDTQWGITWQALGEFNHVQISDVAPEKDGKTISGHNRVQNWVNRELFFSVMCEKPWKNLTRLPSRHADEKSPRYVLDFGADAAGTVVEMKVALSSVSVDGAKASVAAEASGWDFAAVRQETETKWEKLLSLVTIEGDDEKKRNFYTALYHLFIQPNDIADRDGRYRGADNEVKKAESGAYYSTLSTWDTFRASHPLYTLLVPERVPGFMETIVRHHEAAGFLPIWTLGGKDNQCMIGTHSIPILLDAWMKGFRAPGVGDDRIAKALEETLRKNTPGRKKANFDHINRYGWIPFDLEKGESVSRLLELGFDDWCAAQFFAKTGRKEQAAFYGARASLWTNVYDRTTGFMRGRDTTGAWREPFNPYALGSGGGSGNDFTEGNSWQYSWHVLQDPEGLVAAMGGKAKFGAKLQQLFEQPTDAAGMGKVHDVSGLIGQYAHGNEPSHHVIYLFQYAGRPDLTAKYVREVFDTQYHNGADGLCGNDDCGQMSAWYVFSALGFYPVNPCGGTYVLGAPQVARAEMKLGSNLLIVTAKGFSKENKYVRNVTFNGKKLGRFVLTHDELLAGGELVFEMSREP